MGDGVSYKGYRPANTQASRTLSAVGKKDTKPELLLRTTLWARGLRYRLHAGDLPGRPDIVFRGDKVAIFCDGDFWHGKEWVERERRLRKGANAAYWIGKIRRNMLRDKEHNAMLVAEGWAVLRFWESEILRDPEAIADLVEAAIGSRDAES